MQYFIAAILFANETINKNKIVVSSYFGKGYGDNPKYICEYLLSKRSDLEIVWLCKPEVLEHNLIYFQKKLDW